MLDFYVMHPLGYIYSKYLLMADISIKSIPCENYQKQKLKANVDKEEHEKDWSEYQARTSVIKRAYGNNLS